eukprot:SAG22_NODE_22012_length_252_cov_0.673203_1_plen_22_part_10
MARRGTAREEKQRAMKGPGLRE